MTEIVKEIENVTGIEIMIETEIIEAPEDIKTRMIITKKPIEIVTNQVGEENDHVLKDVDQHLDPAIIDEAVH